MASLSKSGSDVLASGQQLVEQWSSEEGWGEWRAVGRGGEGLGRVGSGGGGVERGGEWLQAEK